MQALSGFLLARGPCCLHTQPSFTTPHLSRPLTESIRLLLITRRLRAEIFDPCALFSLDLYVWQVVK